MQAVIMAAGKGTRLGNITTKKPKPLIKIKGVPIIGRTINSLLKVPEISEIIIVTGYMNEQIEKYVKDKCEGPKIRLVFNEDYHAGNVLTICKAEQFIIDGLLLLNADHMFSSKVYQKMIDESKDITLGVFSHRKSLEDEMKVRLNSDRSVGMSKTLKRYDYGYTGITFVGKERIKEYFNCARKLLKSRGKDVVVEQLVQFLSGVGVPVNICDLSDFHFLEVDNIDDYKKAEQKIGLLEAEEKKDEVRIKGIGGTWDIIGILNKYYDLPTIKNVKKEKLGGYLNENYSIDTEKGKFFLQKTGRDLRKNIVAEINVLNFLKERKFPCIPLIRNKNGEYLTEEEGKLYLLSDFIKGDSPTRFNDLSDSRIIEAAITLAEYHKLIQDYSEDKFSNPNTASRAEAIEICSKVRSILKKKKSLDEFDKQIYEIIDKKLELLNNLKLLEKLVKCSQIFCHGDYHGANLIFDKEDKIIGIVDWEYFGWDYRIWEVMRSISFVCDINYTGSMVSPIDMDKAYKYLKAYNNVFPLKKEEFDVMVELIQYKEICCCFVIEQHYLKDNKETDVFLPKQEIDWFWWVENGETFKKKVIDKLR